MIVYVIRNDVNALLYVGQTVRPLAERMAGHRRSGRTDMPISVAMRDLGAERFLAEAVQVCSTLADLNAAERAWIERLGTVWPGGYNLSLGGGRHERTRERISAALRGRSITWGDKIGAALRGRPATPEQRKHLALGRLGGPCPSRSRSNRHRKLNDADVLAIRRLCSEGSLSQREVGERFGVRQVAVSRIARRVTYTWLPDED